MKYSIYKAMIQHKMNKGIINTLLFFIFSVLSIQSNSQYSWIYDSNGNVISGSYWDINPGKPISCYDFATQTRFVLDSSRTEISAFDKSGKLKWKTNPYKDNKIREYRTANPFIIYFRLNLSDYYYQRNPLFMKRFPQRNPEKLLISISYNNTQFGSIDLNDGFYYWMGQD